MEPWIENLWPALKKQLGAPERNLPSGEDGMCQVVGQHKDEITSEGNNSESLKDLNSEPKSASVSRPKDTVRNDANGDVNGDGNHQRPLLTPEGDSVDGQTDVDSVIKEESLTDGERVDSPKSDMEEIRSSNADSGINETVAATEPHHPPSKVESSGNELSDANQEDSLTSSLPPLCNVSLTLPLNPPSFLEVLFIEEDEDMVSTVVAISPNVLPLFASAFERNHKKQCSDRTSVDT